MLPADLPVLLDDVLSVVAKALSAGERVDELTPFDSLEAPG